MKNLLVMRHAKSDWGDSNLSDFDRPLNKRGNKAAPFMAEEIKRRDKIPDIIISSPANRAKTTANLFAKTVGIENEIVFERDFYFGYINDILDHIKSVSKSVYRIMLVGHNPTFESLISNIVENSPYVTMPTAAIASIKLEIDDWSKLTLKSGQLEWILKPKEL